MCFELDSSPPIPPISGAAVSHEDLVLEAADGNRFAAFAAMPDEPSGAGVVILPDVRGLYRFYEELALRFAERGISARSRSTTSGARPASRKRDERLGLHGRGRADDARDDPARRRRRGRLAARPRRRPRSSPSASASAAATRGSRRRAATASRARSASTAACSTATRGLGPISRAAEMKAPILALQAGDDQNITAEQNAAFDEALTAAGVEHEVVTYEGAPHSLLRPQAGGVRGGFRRRLGARARLHRSSRVDSGHGRGCSRGADLDRRHVFRPAAGRARLDRLGRGAARATARPWCHLPGGLTGRADARLDRREEGVGPADRRAGAPRAWPRHGPRVLVRQPDARVPRARIPADRAAREGPRAADRAADLLGRLDVLVARVGAGRPQLGVLAHVRRREGRDAPQRARFRRLGRRGARALPEPSSLRRAGRSGVLAGRHADRDQGGRVRARDGPDGPRARRAADEPAAGRLRHRSALLPGRPLDRVLARPGARGLGRLARPARRNRPAAPDDDADPAQRRGPRGVDAARVVAGRKEAARLPARPVLDRGRRHARERDAPANGARYPPWSAAWS